MPRFPIFITVLAIVALVTLRAGDAAAWESTRRVPPPYDDSKPPPDEQLRSLLPATQQQQQEPSSKKTAAPATNSLPQKPLPSEAKPEAADTATAAPAAAAAPAPSSTSSASEQALGDSFRAALQEYMDRYEGATEQDGKFEELFPHKSLSVTRIQHARIHKSYTTCIDTQIKLMALALGKTNLELVSKINSDLSERYKREKLQLPLGAWNEVVHELLPSVYPRGRWVTDPVKNKWSAFTPNPNTTYVDPRLPGSPRPQKGDVYVFIFDTEVLDPVTKKVKNSAGSFSHMGFVSSVKPAAAGSTVETWLTYDGGAGSAPKYDITKIGAVDEAIKPEWYLWGKEKIVTNHRRFDTSRNKFLEGVAGQEGEGRALLGWISMDKMVRPISPKPEPSTGKVPPKPKGVAAIAKLAKGKSLDPSASAPPSAPSATPSAALPAQ